MVILADLVADHYISCTPKRVSREAPILILKYEGESWVLGGGANAVVVARIRLQSGDLDLVLGHLHVGLGAADVLEHRRLARRAGGERIQVAGRGAVVDAGNRRRIAALGAPAHDDAGRRGELKIGPALDRRR